VAGTIYEWGGGREAFASWLNRFYDLVEREAPEIAAMFGGRVSKEHREHVTDWWTEVMGGPAAYTERRGGYERMLTHHHDLAITAEQRLAFVTLLSRAADDVGLPNDPEFRAAIMGYAEWGNAPGGPQLAAGRTDGRARTGSEVGVGSRSAVCACGRRQALTVARARSRLRACLGNGRSAHSARSCSR
jgi:hemoglobin